MFHVEHHNVRSSVLEYRSFFAPLFSQKKRTRSRASSPCRRPQTAKFPAQCYLRAEKGVRNPTGFRGGANKTAPPCGSRWERQISKMFRWNILDETSIFFSALPTLPSGRASDQKSFRQRKRGWGRWFSGTLALAHWLAKMSGNWSLTLPLPVTNCTIYRLANSAG
jgi:hypothetical protein